MKNKLTQEEAKEFIKDFAMPKRGKPDLPKIPIQYCALLLRYGLQNIKNICGMLRRRKQNYNCIQVCYADFYMGKREEKLVFGLCRSFMDLEPEYPEIKCVKSDCTIDTAPPFRQCINICYWYPGGRE